MQHATVLFDCSVSRHRHLLGAADQHRMIVQSRMITVLTVLEQVPARLSGDVSRCNGCSHDRDEDELHGGTYLARVERSGRILIPCESRLPRLPNGVALHVIIPQPHPKNVVSKVASSPCRGDLVQ